MSLQLPIPRDQYDRQYEDQRNRAIEQADRGSHKRGQDLELGRNERIIMRSPDGARWALTVANDGTLSVAAA